MIFLIVFSRQEKPIVIQKENVSKTSQWKSYKNSEYHFSFKYPEGELSNFTISTIGQGNTTLHKIALTNKETRDPNLYNVFFEAGVIKSTENLNEFINKNFPETKGSARHHLIYRNLQGLRITNIDKKSNAYFIYNLFQKNGVIYNFSLLSDDPVLIDANKPLLEDILTTVRFE